MCRTNSRLSCAISCALTMGLHGCAVIVFVFKTIVWLQQQCFPCIWKHILNPLLCWQDFSCLCFLVTNSDLIKLFETSLWPIFSCQWKLLYSNVVWCGFRWSKIIPTRKHRWEVCFQIPYRKFYSTLFLFHSLFIFLLKYLCLP